MLTESAATTRHSLPGSLTAKYHFNPKGRFSPHLGAGLDANLDVKQIFLDPKAKLNGGAIVAETALNPHRGGPWRGLPLLTGASRKEA